MSATVALLRGGGASTSRFRVLALATEILTQVDVTGSRLGVLLAEDFVPDVQGLPEEPLSLEVLALGIEVDGQAAVALGSVRMLLPQYLAVDGQRTLEQRFSLGMLT